ncbi:hypothetical protein Hanom_Chr15g01412501 [Helianthus anomalus]
MRRIRSSSEIVNLVPVGIGFDINGYEPLHKRQWNVPCLKCKTQIHVFLIELVLFSYLAPIIN